MAISLGDGAVTAMYLGDKPVTRAYLGDDLVFGTAPPTGTVSGGVLPFNMPTREARAAITSHSVFAHYFHVFPQIVDNKPPDDTWESLWLPPGGGQWVEKGGRVRKRKNWSEAVGPETGTLSNAQLIDNLETEIQWGIDAGLDGFASEILVGWTTADTPTPDVRTLEVQNLLTALKNKADPYFWVAPMMDGYASGTATTDTTIQTLKNFITWSPSTLWKRVEGGKTIVMLPTFSPEGAPQSSVNGTSLVEAKAFWTTVLAAMRTWVKAQGHGDDVALWGAYVYDPVASAASLNPLAYGHGRWGEPWTEDYGGTRLTDPATFYASYGKPWLAYVKREVYRPKLNDFRDGHGTRSFADQWVNWINTRNITTAVQVVTWDDFGEGTEIAPTSEDGRAWADLNAFYAMWYKFGEQPTIVRDCVYLSNRRMIVGGSNTYTGGQTVFVTNKGLNPTSNLIEARVFATQQSTVEFRIDGTLVRTATVDPGITSVAIPAQLGLPTVRLMRGGGVVTEVEGVRITNVLPSENVAYYLASSLRQNPTTDTLQVLPDDATVEVVATSPTIGTAGGLLIEEVKVEVDPTAPYTITLPTMDVPDGSLMILFAGCSRISNVPTLSASGMTFTSLTPASVQPTSSNATLHAWSTPVSAADSGKTITATWSIADKKTAWVGLVVSGQHATDALHKVVAGANNWATAYTVPTTTTTEANCVEVQVFLAARGDNTANDGFTVPAAMVQSYAAHSTGTSQNVSIAVGTTGTLVGSGTVMGGDTWGATLAGVPQTNGNCAYVFAIRQA